MSTAPPPAMARADEAAMSSPSGKRADLVSGLRARHKARRDTPAAPPRASATGLRVKPYDFADLPDLKSLAMMETAAATFDLKPPFFRCHDGLPGAEQEIDGTRAINFASYNYLGLNGDPRLAEAAKAAIDIWGVSAAA
ncbi:MAG: hypothetical protein AAGF44_03195, partial [Pseudomonadota bacterium]